MVKKYLTLWFLGLSLIMAGTANATEHKEQSQKQIERYVAQQRKMMEDFYQRKIARLNKSADKKIKRMEQSQREKLITMAQIERQRRIDNWGYVSPEDFLTITNEQKDAAEKQIDHKKKELLDKLDISIDDIEKQKEYTLSKIASREKRLKDRSLAKPKLTHGVVTGIVYSSDKPMIILDRNFMGEGEIMFGVKIVKIYPDKVEFKKNNKQWTQNVGEKVNLNWPQ